MSRSWKWKAGNTTRGKVEAGKGGSVVNSVAIGTNLHSVPFYLDQIDRVRRADAEDETKIPRESSM